MLFELFLEYDLFWYRIRNIFIYLKTKNDLIKKLKIIRSLNKQKLYSQIQIQKQ